MVADAAQQNQMPDAPVLSEQGIGTQPQRAASSGGERSEKNVLRRRLRSLFTLPRQKLRRHNETERGGELFRSGKRV